MAMLKDSLKFDRADKKSAETYTLPSAIILKKTFKPKMPKDKVNKNCENTKIMKLTMNPESVKYPKLPTKHSLEIPIIPNNLNLPTANTKSKVSPDPKNTILKNLPDSVIKKYIPKTSTTNVTKNRVINNEKSFTKNAISESRILEIDSKNEKRPTVMTKPNLETTKARTPPVKGMTSNKPVIEQPTMNRKSKVDDAILHPNCSNCGIELDNFDEFLERMKGFHSNFLLDLLCINCSNQRRNKLLNLNKLGDQGSLNADIELEKPITESEAEMIKTELTDEDECEYLVEFLDDDDNKEIRESNIPETTLDEQQTELDQEDVEYLMDFEDFEALESSEEMEIVNEANKLNNSEVVSEDKTNDRKLETSSNQKSKQILQKKHKFMCALCDISYPTLKALRGHGWYKHNPDKPYQKQKTNAHTQFYCDLCDLSYKSYRNLQSHNYYKHPNEFSKKRNKHSKVSQKVKSEVSDNDIEIGEATINKTESFDGEKTKDLLSSCSNEITSSIEAKEEIIPYEEISMEPFVLNNIAVNHEKSFLGNHDISDLIEEIDTDTIGDMDGTMNTIDDNIIHHINEEIVECEPGEEQHAIQSLHCTYCDDTFELFSELRKHEYNVHNIRKNSIENSRNKYQCFICNTSYSSYKNLQSHIYYKHAYGESKKLLEYRRRRELKVVKKKRYLNLTKIGEQIVLIDNKVQNEESTDVQSSIDSAQESNSSKATFMCPICKKFYRSEQLVKAHIEFRHNSNVVNTPFNCLECDISFMSYRYLQNHIYYKHPADGVKRSGKVHKITKTIVGVDNTVNDVQITNDDDNDAGSSANKNDCNIKTQEIDLYDYEVMEFQPTKEEQDDISDTQEYYLDECEVEEEFKTEIIEDTNLIEYIGEQNEADATQDDADVVKVAVNRIDSKSNVNEKVIEEFTINQTDIEKNDDKSISSDQWESDTNMDNKEIKFICSVCSKAFKSMILLKTHEIYRHNPENEQGKERTQFFCDLCNMSYKSYKNLQSHIYYKHRKNDRPRSYECRICNETFRLQRNRQKHEVEEHADKETGRYNCMFCEMTYCDAVSLRGHLFAHINFYPFICEQCGKGFLQRKYLQAHYKSHIEGRPYKCKMCNGSFKRLEYFKKHLITHTNERKWFQCKTCDKKYADRRDCMRHEFTHGTFEKKFICEICTKRFHMREELRRHMRCHRMKLKA